MQNETIIPQIKTAEAICYATLAELSKSKDISVEETPYVLDMARSLVDCCISRAKYLDQKKHEPKESAQQQNTDTDLTDNDEKVMLSKQVAGKCCKNNVNKYVLRHIDAIQHMFNAFAMMETYLAKQENRKVNEKLLSKMAFRISRAIMKDDKDINADKIITDIYRDKDGGYSVEILMPKKNKKDEK